MVGGPHDMRCFHSYRIEGDVVHPVALSGDVFIVDREKVTARRPRPNLLVELERDARMRPRANPVTDDELRRVAAIVAQVPYRERRRAVADALGVSLSTAKSRIAEARRRGFISP